MCIRDRYRRQGIMAAMLTKCLNDMHQKRQPFTYLMPANKAYYEPFQFTFVMDWEETMIHSMNDSDKIIPVSYTHLDVSKRQLIHREEEVLPSQRNLIHPI